jgi:hypothetical protein
MFSGVRLMFLSSTRLLLPSRQLLAREPTPRRLAGWFLVVALSHGDKKVRVVLAMGLVAHRSGLVVVLFTVHNPGLMPKEPPRR